MRTISKLETFKISYQKSITQLIITAYDSRGFERSIDGFPSNIYINEDGTYDCFWFQNEVNHRLGGGCEEEAWRPRHWTKGETYALFGEYFSTINFHKIETSINQNPLIVI